MEQLNTITSIPAGTPAGKKYLTIEYKFYDSDGETCLGSSEASGSYTYEENSGDALPGLRDRLQTATAGDSLEFMIPAEKGYGSIDDSLIRLIPKETLPKDMDAQEGRNITINGHTMMITEIHKDAITVDGNHPLAGVDLQFKVKVLSISDTPPEPKEHSCGCGNSCGCGKH